MQAMTPSANHSPASHSSTSRAAPASSSSSNGKSDAASEIHQARSFGDANASKTSRFTLGQPARSLPSSSDEQPESALTTQPQEELGDLTALAALLSAHQPIPTQAQWVKGFAENHRIGGANTANTAAAQNANAAAAQNANAAAPSATGQSAAERLNAQSALATSESQPVATKAALPLDSALNAALNQAIHPASGAPSHGQAQAQVHASSAATTVVNAPEWASVRIDTKAGKWGEQMLQVLHDRVTLQAQQHLQEAKIRLDPPDLGKLDLVVRVEGDRLSVQINANAAATREALMQVSDRLRAELQSQNFVHVDVNVSADQGDQRQSSSQDEAAASTIFAARDTADEPFTASLSEHWLSTHA
ncbi:flagellar hook-length control protein FliK [Vibrio furnissii]|uniref:flagellar hook-length control protein FliK n=1 Tax=Vibrio furnissii TaxID=29494 RepID=UPI001EEA5D27|nr:flagellar hook-length control protein FliK [Vibrio furnissii]MCG6218779.1 flagellar hook-length control protein FliK [Vibrio furnissii]